MTCADLKAMLERVGECQSQYLCHSNKHKSNSKIALKPTDTADQPADSANRNLQNLGIVEKKNERGRSL